MNIQQLRHSLKLKWVTYYDHNRSWLIKMRVWGTYDGQRRVSSGFILATVSALEPQLEEIFPFILELNNDPDQIVAALGLNFNPEDHLDLVESANSLAEEVKSESWHQTLPKYQPLTPSVIGTKVENNGEPLPSVGVRSEVLYEVPPEKPTQSKPLTLSAILTEVESQSESVESLAIASTQVESKSNSVGLMTTTTTKLESKSQSMPLIAFFHNKGKSKSQSLPSVSVTLPVGRKRKPRSLLTVDSSDGESKSQSMSLAGFIASKVDSKPVSSVPFATQVERKGRLVTTPQKDAHHEVNLPRATTRPLANWIDDFCQGVEWDQAETRFIP